MRLNGLYVVADLAMRKVASPLVDRYRSALVLGSLREDVWWIPGLRVVFEHLSFSHFYEPPLPGGYLPIVWPGPRMKGELFFRRAVREHRRGNVAGGFVQLGRVVHLVTDMCCPVHVHRAVHTTDPYEWWIEGNAKKLLALDVPEVADFARARDAIEAMAAWCKPFRADLGNHHAGRVFKKLGLLRTLTSREAGEQAKVLIPMAAAHAAAVIRLYLREIGEVVPAARSPRTGSVALQA